MADPASILGIISASLTITVRAATIGKDIHRLIAKFKTTNKKVRQLSTHVSAVRVAARSLSAWLEDDAVGSEHIEHVKRELLDVLSACCDLLSDLQDHVAKALAGAEHVGFKGAVDYIWDEDIVEESVETLHHQEVALLLMLQTLKFLRYSSVSGSSGSLDAVFTFDTEVMASTVYRNAFTTLLRRKTQRPTVTRNHEDRPESTAIPNSLPSTTFEDEPVANQHEISAPQQPPHLTAPLAKTAVRPMKVFRVQAVWDWLPPIDEGVDYLRLSAGDEIWVIVQYESGWWGGVIDGVPGCFPSNYSEPYPPSEVSESDLELSSLNGHDML
ncbi:hypothetical protein BDV96DRAFT_636132 [Lophiotrema nucula]|uniref:SH3 domain-containing protein n=1 Tax=Lophiotrema nucula TaxID=690887 RepID=A0A6A5YRU3_9PLEO|nr:hypothetical protein BDV96DRAFT_636132 [Lophiotrema nucula]